MSEQGNYLARLVNSLETPARIDPDTAAYFELLDRALEDRRLSAAEAAALAATAHLWGLDAGRVRAAHDTYFRQLVAMAAADGVITGYERADLIQVAQLLAVDTATIDVLAARERSAPTSTTSIPQESFRGKSVCFTGALTATMNGDTLTRDLAHELARNVGLIVKDGVSRGLDLLVVADPDSQSGKAKRARELGTRIIAEAVFWRAIGVEVD